MSLATVESAAIARRTAADPTQRLLNVQDLGQAAENCVRKTIHLVWTMVRYPAGNANIRQSAEAWRQSLKHVLILQNSFVITVIKDQLYYEDHLMPKTEDSVGNFIDSMSQRRLRKVIFWRGADEHDMESFADLMGARPPELLESGGPAVLLKRLGPRNLSIVEAKYLAPDMVAESMAAREYWQAKLEDAGLDSGEVIAFLSGRGRLPRIITAEIALLIEAMKDPRFLSELLLQVAMEGMPGRQPDARELLRICKRTQYLLLVNSIFHPTQTPGILARAAASFPRPLRLELLAAKLGLEENGQESIDAELVAFQPDEYAEYLVASRETGESWQERAERLVVEPGLAASICLSVKARLLTSPRLTMSAEEADRDLAGLFDLLTCGVRGTPGQLPECPAGNPSQQEGGLDLLRQRAETFTQNLTEGYTYAVLKLLAIANDPAWADDLLDRLVIIVEARLEARRYGEILSLLHAAWCEHLAPEWLDDSRNRFRQMLQRIDYQLLISYALEQISSGNREIFEAAKVVIDVFGPTLLERTVQELLEGAANFDEPLLIEFLSIYSDRLLPIFKRHLQEGSALDRARVIETLFRFPSERVQELASRGLEDPNPHVRMLTILLLGKASVQHGTGTLLELIHAGRSGELCCAAILTLGRFRCTDAVVPLEKILRKRAWIPSRQRHEMKVSAALALRRIGTTRCYETLRERLPDLDRTVLEIVLGRVLRWVKRKWAVVVRYVRKAIDWLDLQLRRIAAALKATAEAIVHSLVLILLSPWYLARASWKMGTSMARLAGRFVRWLRRSTDSSPSGEIQLDGSEDPP